MPWLAVGHPEVTNYLGVVEEVCPSTWNAVGSCDQQPPDRLGLGSVACVLGPGGGGGYSFLPVKLAYS